MTKETKELRLLTLECNRCKSRWFPRIANRPKHCPRCKSPYWDKARVRPVRK